MLACKALRAIHRGKVLRLAALGLFQSNEVNVLFLVQGKAAGTESSAPRDESSPLQDESSSSSDEEGIMSDPELMSDSQV